MARFSAVPPPPELTSLAANTQSQVKQPPATSNTADAAGTTTGTVGIDIEAWTISALQSLSVSPVARGTGTPLSIPLDDGEVKVRRTKTPTGNTKSTEAGLKLTPQNDETVLVPRRPPSARDSLKKREALQRGNEGSRQRRRWENDRLVGVPNAQLPLPVDCLPRATHPVNYTPYHVAHYWDKSVRDRVEEKTCRLQAARKRQQLQSGSATGIGMGEVPRDLRESTKRSPVVRSWVRGLEEPIRRLLEDQSQDSPAKPGPTRVDEGSDWDGEEVLFTGRKGMKKSQEEPGQWKMARREVMNETVEMGVVFESFGDGESAAFRRWLTHSISDYYGLESKSVTTGNPARRVVYVGVKSMGKRKTANIRQLQLPRPLWEVC